VENGLALADYLIVAGFFVVMLAIGFYFSGRMKSLKDFFGGGNQVPWWVSGVSLYMSTFSAFAFVAYSATAYKDGLVAVIIWWSGVPCWLISARFLAARWRRAASTSPLEFIETRYGAHLRQGFAWLGIPLIVIDDALKLFVIGTMVTVSLGNTAPHALMWAILICGTIMLTYTFLGGLWAVMVTDFIQFVVMGTAVIVLIPLVLIRVGGFGAFVHGTPEGFWSPTSETFPWFWLVAFLPIQLFSYSTRWSLVQRYYAVKDDAQARKVGYLVAGLTFIGVPLLFFPAMAARIFMPGIEDGNTVYPLLCRELLPVGMMGMVIAAMFSATMSMLSSDYNAVASVLTNDVYKRLIAPDASERSLVLVGRLATLVIGFLALGAALFLASAPGTKDLVKIMASLFGVLLPPVAIPMIFGLITRRVSYAGGFDAFLAGALSGIACYVLSYVMDLPMLRDIRCLTWFTSIPSLVMMIRSSVLQPDAPDKRERVARFLDGIEDKVTVADGTQEDGAQTPSMAASALQIIGLASAAIGALVVVAVVATAPVAEVKLSIVVGSLMLMVGLGATGLARKLMAGQ